MPARRYAVYFTPSPDSRLARFGADVLGYDCHAAVDVPHLSIPAIDPSVLALVSEEPRRYGFHATLVAPFRLGEKSEAELEAAFSAFASRHPPVPLGPFEVTCIGSFIALRLAKPHARVNEFASACVETFDQFRAPLSQSDRQRRLKSGLSERQQLLMERWGYPYVFDEFRFHMTLTGALPESQRAPIKAALARAFEPLAHDHVELGAISLMRQDDPASRFAVLSRARLSGKQV